MFFQNCTISHLLHFALFPVENTALSIHNLTELSDPWNYLPLYDKLIEALFQSELVKHLTSQEILSEKQ